MSLTTEDINAIYDAFGPTTGASIVTALDAGLLVGGGDFRLTNTQWDDLNVPLNTTVRGSNDLPHYDYDNHGLLFPQNDANEIVYLVFQMRHAKKLGTAIKLHVHYIQSAVAQPTFKVQYKFYNNGSAVSADWTTIGTGDTGGDKGVFDYPGTGSILQIGAFPSIAAPANEDVSANLDVKLYRQDNDVTGDVLTKYIDLHYEKDKLGSDDEYSNN